MIIDFGSDLPATQSYLAGGLRLRPSRGVDDPLDLGLLPELGRAYRSDAVVDGEDLERARDARIKDGIFTHGHFDHIGSLWALSPEIRFHTSAATAGFLLADTVCGKGLYSELTHIRERVPHPDEQGILRLPRSAPRLSRTVLLTDRKPTKEFLQVWNSYGSTDGLGRSDLTAAGIPFETVPVDHSIFGATSVVLHTERGVVAHCGDFRTHGTEAELTEALCRRLRKLRPRLLIVEGTRLNRSDDPRVTEPQCRRKVVSLVRSATGRLVMGIVSPKHFERMAAYLLAAMETGRKLVIPPKTFITLQFVAAANPYYHDLITRAEIAIYDGPSLARPSWHRELRSTNPKLLVHADDIRTRPGRYILMLGLGKIVDWLDLQPYQAMLIYSTSRAYDAEARLRLGTLATWVREFDIQTEGIELGAHGGTKYDPVLNPSGHVHPQDLARFLEEVRPEIVVPCHTAHPEAMRDFLPSSSKLLLPEINKGIRL